MNFFLSGYEFEETFYSFFPKDEIIYKNHNLFTVIIGNNGIGKSRLLSKIEGDLLKTTEDINNIISISLSNSHKFNSAVNTNQNLFIPMHKPNEFSSGFTVLDTSSNSWISKINNYINYKNNESISFLSLNYYTTKVDILDYKSIFNLCIRNIIDDNLLSTTNIVTQNIKKVLSFLNFNENLTIKFKLSRSYKDFKSEAFNNKNILDFINNICLALKIKKIEDIENKKFSLFDEIYELEDFIFLLMEDIVEIQSINLKIIADKEIYYSELSSGQKTILSIGLSLIASLKDNSIILIDEPELGLHPEWQEKIMLLIQEISNPYIGCQFIIATHSPQIISSIQYPYSYLLDLSNNKVTNISKLKNRSSDFQLSKVFETPGNNNEYILRKILIILNKLNTNIVLSEDESHTKELVKKLYYEEKFPEQDKVKTLVEILLQIEAK